MIVIIEKKINTIFTYKYEVKKITHMAKIYNLLLLFFSLLNFFRYLTMRPTMHNRNHLLLLLILQFRRPHCQHPIRTQFRHNTVQIIAVRNWITSLEIAIDESVIVRSFVVFRLHLQEIIHNFHLDLFGREMLHIQTDNEIVGFLDNSLFRLALLTL